MLQIMCTSDRTCIIGFRSEGGSEDASKVCGISPQRREPSVAKVGGLQISQTGTYQLGLRAADWALWTLDGRVVVENSTAGVDAIETVTLDQGPCELRIRYKDSVQSSRLHLLWRPPGQEALVGHPLTASLALAGQRPTAEVGGTSRAAQCSRTAVKGGAKYTKA